MCHPDIAGQEGGNLCILLNYAYATLKCAAIGHHGPAGRRSRPPRPYLPQGRREP